MMCSQSDIFVLRKHGLISGVYNVILVQTCLEIILPHQNVLTFLNHLQLTIGLSVGRKICWYFRLKILLSTDRVKSC